MSKHTIMMLVDNRYGALARVSGLFAKRAYNIESLTVGKTNILGQSRMTIVVECTEGLVEQIVEQLKKIEDIIAVDTGCNGPLVGRELMLVKVKHDPKAPLGLVETINVFRGNIIDITPCSAIVEITGTEDKLNAFLEYVKTFGVIEVSRTGETALARGASSLGK